MADRAVMFVTYSLELQLWPVTSDQRVQKYLAHKQLTVVISSVQTSVCHLYVTVTVLVVATGGPVKPSGHTVYCLFEHYNTAFPPCLICDPHSITARASLYSIH